MDQATFDAARKRQTKKDTTSKWEGLLKAGSRGNLSWSDAGEADLLAAVVAVTEDGAALLLSKTSDGGALLVQVLVDKDTKPKHYASNMAELNEVLANLGSVE